MMMNWAFERVFNSQYCVISAKKEEKEILSRCKHYKHEVGGLG